MKGSRIGALLRRPGLGLPGLGFRTMNYFVPFDDLNISSIRSVTT